MPKSPEQFNFSLQRDREKFDKLPSGEKWDGLTPYSVHPIWCATMILHETALAEDIRVDGSQALLFHDVLEDTLAELPNYLSERVKNLVQDMTFESSDVEMLKVWDKPIEVKLFKLYDKVSNLMDARWMPDG